MKVTITTPGTRAARATSSHWGALARLGTALTRVWKIRSMTGFGGWDRSTGQERRTTKSHRIARSSVYFAQHYVERSDECDDVRNHHPLRQDVEDAHRREAGALDLQDRKSVV